MKCGPGSVEAVVPAVGRLTDLRMPDERRSRCIATLGRPLNDDIGKVLNVSAAQLQLSTARLPPQHSDSNADEDAMIAAMFQRIDYWPKKVFSPRPAKTTKLDPGIKLDLTFSPKYNFGAMQKFSNLLVDNPKTMPSQNNSFRNKVYSKRKSPERIDNTYRSKLKTFSVTKQATMALVKENPQFDVAGRLPPLPLRINRYLAPQRWGSPSNEPVDHAKLQKLMQEYEFSPLDLSNL